MTSPPWFESFDSYLRFGAVAGDIVALPALGTAAIQARADQRLQALCAHAIVKSTLYARLWRDAGPRAALAQLPVVDKSRLMAAFDDWVCDRRIARAEVEAFLADPARLGSTYLDQYTIWTSSGTTGVPGIFVQDASALAVYDALEFLRVRGFQSPQRWADAWTPYGGNGAPASRIRRYALVAVTSGPFAGVTSALRLRRLLGPGIGQMQSFSLLQPLAELVERLNAYQPGVLATYPTAALILADEQRAGRLRLSLAELLTGGENLTAELRTQLAAAFACRVVNDYGASECMTIAFDCAQGNLHLNADWVVLEAVDRNLIPVAPGTTSYTCLLTNLANYVAPIIRYDLGDCIEYLAQPCACGSALPALRVHGRSDEIIELTGVAERPVRLAPLALTTVLEDEAGLFRFQLTQTDQQTLSLRIGSFGDAQGPDHLDHDRDADAATPAFERARGALGAFLLIQGVAGCRIVFDPTPPQPEPCNGKLRRVRRAASVKPAAA